MVLICLVVSHRWTSLAMHGTTQTYQSPARFAALQHPLAPASVVDAGQTSLTQPRIRVGKHRLELLAREVALRAVDGFEPRAVHRQQLFAKEVQLAAEIHEAAKGGFKGRGVLAPEVGHGLEIWT